MKKLALLIIAFFTLTITSVSPALAQNKEIIVITENETINRDYFGFAERVEVNGTINGDAYIAGGMVFVNGTINGDLLAAGGNLTISGTVTGDVRAAGGNIQLTGADVGGNVTLGGGNVNIDESTQIQGSIVAGSGNLQVFAPIGRGATIGAGSVTLANSIGSDVKAATDDLNLTSNANIKGDLTYWSERDANISEGATVSGNIVKELPKDREVNRNDAEFAGDAAKALGGMLLAVKVLDLFWLTIIGLLIIILLPNFSTRTSNIASKKLGWAILVGFLALIILPIISIIFMITLVGIPVAILIFLLFMFMFWIGRVFALLALGRFVMGRISKKNNSNQVAYLVGILIYLILALIPVIGFLTSVAVSLSGVGALLMSKKESYQDLRKKNIL